ncbi:unnamed protein product [Phytomonas sp. EM1]|nr:unnamed protein product [Phytomonas sp. EM1]|eukprot:CCW61617.1 unnamed protein product [Phytomonas sp. isolate EM1]
MPVSLWWWAACRAFQGVMYVVALFIPWRRPELLKGPGAISKLPAFIKGKRLQRGLIVTDGVLMRLGLLDSFISGMKDEGLEVFIYQGVTPNPTEEEVEEGLKQYLDNQCDHIIGFGGGSPIDCAKLVGARVVRPNKTVKQMGGVFKVLRELPPLFAVPTTAGTGTECTLGAVVVDTKAKEKYPVEDPSLFPHYAVLDPCLTLTLPKFDTAATGMDALSHAVEAYVNILQTEQTERDAITAVKLVFENLRNAYNDGSDLEARTKMMDASYIAGLAFTRAYVGYVHAISHTLSGLYDLPHGYANAVLLPPVLEAYGPPAHRRLANLAEAIGISKGNDAERAQKFIQAIRDLNAALDIPETMSWKEEKHVINKDDIPLMVSRALSEANPLYPVPTILGAEELIEIIKQIM